jgi:CRISPR system Cascade subunit CasC
MIRFIQLHLLTSYPPANLNRDDLGQPKTARFGGVERIRVSSQSLKRAWRTSTLFQEALSGTIGTRTKRIGAEAYKRLVAGGVAEKKARKWAEAIATVFGELKKDDSLEIEQLVHVSPDELEAVNALADRLIAEGREPTKEELDDLLRDQSAVDIAMFGRMLAATPQHNVEAAVQVAHALGVHASAVEDDFFTAVDDLKRPDEDAGAGHVGEAGFAAAVFYQYLCINKELLEQNLAGDSALASRAIRALVEAAHRVAPNGKQNSFGSRAYAHYSMVEKGDQQPRSLALAFLRPVSGEDYAEESSRRLAKLVEQFDQTYGQCADARSVMDVLNGSGTLGKQQDFAAGD